MKRFGKGFIISVVLLVAAITCFILKLYLWSAIICTPVFFLNTGEIKSYASFYQFINFRIHTLLLGLSVDLLLGEKIFPYTISMFMLSFAGLLRLELFQSWLLQRNSWSEILGLTGAYGFYFYANLMHPADWRGWVLPVLPILFMTYIGGNIIKDAVRIKLDLKKPFRAKPGEKAKDFSLPDADGKMVSLSEFAGKNHVLLIFVRGDWCPTCHIMIRTYEKNREKFIEKDVVAIGIGPDSTEVNLEMVKRLGAKNIFLSDLKQEVTREYGISFFENGLETKYPEGIPLPASFLIDKEGVIRHVSRPDKPNEFLNPAHIFTVIEQLG